MISKRTIDARAVFEQNTSAGQLNQRRASYQPSTLNSSGKWNIVVTSKCICIKKKKTFILEVEISKSTTY